MASSLQSRAITDVYRRRLAELRRLIERATLSAWQSVDPTDIDATLPPVLQQVEALVSVGQSEAVRAAHLYLVTFMASELGEVVDLPVPDVTSYAGFTRDGRRVADVLALSSVSMKVASEYGTGEASVTAAGLARTLRVVRTETVDAARTAQRDMMSADGRVDGFYRATSGEPCGACLGLAGKRSRTDEVFPIHGACSCTMEPIVGGVPDRHRPPTGSDMLGSMSSEKVEELYGPAAPGLLDGSVRPEDMVTRRDAKAWGAMAFQTPVSKLPG